MECQCGGNVRPFLFPLQSNYHDRNYGKLRNVSNTMGAFTYSLEEEIGVILYSNGVKPSENRSKDLIQTCRKK